DLVTGVQTCALPISLRTFKERPVLKFGECLLQLLLRIHHDGTVPGNRLLKRLSRNQQKANSIIPGLNRHFVAAVKQYERAVVRFDRRSRVQPLDSLGWHREWASGIA